MARRVDRALRAVAPVALRRPDTRHARIEGERRDLEALRELIETGDVVPTVDHTYPLSETAAAIHDVQHGHVRGKAVIAI